MGNMMDYIKWRGDLTLEQAPFNIIDALILTELAYTDYANYITEDPIHYTDAVKKLFDAIPKEKRVMGLIVPQKILDLNDAAARSTRFGSLYVSHYVDEVEVETRCQFSAMTFHLANGDIFLSYRGTDDTFVGWQEDMDFMIKDATEGEIRSLRYLETMASIYPKSKIYIGGHSKGGHLANYVGLHLPAKLKKRVVHVYSMDGPGFRPEVVDMEEYETMREKITLVTPKDSVVGMLFDTFCGNVLVVDSTSHGVNQHDAFSWKLEGTKFQTVSSITKNSQGLRMAIAGLLERMTPEERIAVAEDVYKLIVDSDMKTLLEASKDKIKTLRGLSTLSAKNKRLFLEFISYFIKYKSI